MEKFEADIYRKGLAASLGELRNDGEMGKEVARELLDTAKGATLYPEAKKLKQEAYGAKVQESPSEEPPQSLPEAQVDTVHHQQVELSPEQLEQKIIAELLTLVETNPHVTFSMSVYGKFSISPFYKGSMHDVSSGSSSYVFDVATQQFMNKGLGDKHDPLRHRSEALRGWGNFYQPALNCKPLRAAEGEERKWWGHVYTGGMLYSPRGGVNFLGGLFVPSIDEVYETFSPEIKKYFIQRMNKPESARILWKFFCAAFQKYDPVEWTQLVGFWEQQPGNEGKKIEDYFSDTTEGIV